MPDVTEQSSAVGRSLFARCYIGCKKYFWYGLVLIIVAIGTNAYQYYVTRKHVGTIETQSGELLTQKFRISELQGELDAAEDRASQQEAENRFTSSLGLYVAAKFAELDEVLLKTDRNSLDFIRWMIENAYFYGDAKDEAGYRYGQWQAVQLETDDEYRKIKDDIDEKLGTQEEAPMPSTRS